MSTKQHDPVQAVKQAFQEAWCDNELQTRYEGFEKILNEAKKSHNELIPQINKNLYMIDTLEDIVLKQAIVGILAPATTEKIQQLEAENAKLIQRLEQYKETINENAALIEKYENWSERKLFIWWQAISAVDPTTVPWLEWKDGKEIKIF